jgi:hypothetical protein
MKAASLLPIAIAAICFTAASACFAADKIEGFSKLPSGDLLQLHFSSQGCFNHYSCDLTLSHTDGSLAAVRMDTEGREIGRLELSEADIAGLDALLAFYRTNIANGCTTTDKIRISQVRDGKVIASEQFTDSSCQASAIKDVVTIESLMQRLTDKKAKN